MTAVTGRAFVYRWRQHTQCVKAWTILCREPIRDGPDEPPPPVSAGRGILTGRDTVVRRTCRPHLRLTRLHKERDGFRGAGGAEAAVGVRRH